MNECIIYLLLLKYVIDDGIINLENFNVAHISYLCFRFGKQMAGTERGPYVLILSISFVWKKIKFQHKTTSDLCILK